MVPPLEMSLVVPSKDNSEQSRRSSVTLAIAVWYFHLSTEQRAVRQWRPGWQIESKTSTANPFLCAAEISLIHTSS